MTSGSTAGARVLRLAGHLCRLGLAVVFLLAGGLKMLDPEGFAREAAQYGILPAWLTGPFAGLLLPLEVAVGAALLLNFRPVLALGLAAGMLLLFIGAISFALATDQPLEACGCFGRNITRTPSQTLVEDLLFLGAALLGMAGLRGAQTAPRWKGAVLVAVLVASTAFVIASPHLPIDDLATSIRPGARWSDLGVGLAEVDLGKGAYLVAIMGMKDEATAARLPELNELASAGRFTVVGLHGDDDEAYNEFFWSRGPAFPIYKITASDLRVMHRRLPRCFAVKDGTVTATWPGVPTAAAAAAALGTAPS